MKQHRNEIYIYYDPATSTGKQTRAYAYTLCNHVNMMEYNKIHLTSTLWRELLDKLHLRPKDLLDRSHRDYQTKIRGNTFDDEGWLNILIHYPHLIKAPIATWRNRAVLCCRPTDILRLEA